MFRLGGRLKLSRLSLLEGTILAAFGTTTLQVFSTELLAGAGRNPILAPFAIIVGLLIWFNLVARSTWFPPAGPPSATKTSGPPPRNMTKPGGVHGRSSRGRCRWTRTRTPRGSHHSRRRSIVGPGRPNPGGLRRGEYLDHGQVPHVVCRCGVVDGDQCAGCRRRGVLSL